MAKRTVRAQLDVEAELANKGVVFQYMEDGDLVGWLEVGKATLKWTDKKGKKPDGECDWRHFIEWIKNR